VLIAPASRIVPPKNRRTSCISANGLSMPACPPAPAQTRIRPSTPACIALRACRTLITSWKTSPPQACTRGTISSGARSDVITIGTRNRSQTSISCASRSFDA
jgi:hypothetical protein